MVTPSPPPRSWGVMKSPADRMNVNLKERSQPPPPREGQAQPSTLLHLRRIRHVTSSPPNQAPPETIWPKQTFGHTLLLPARDRHPKTRVSASHRRFSLHTALWAQPLQYLGDELRLPIGKSVLALKTGAHKGGLAHDAGEGGISRCHPPGRRRPDLSRCAENLDHRIIAACINGNGALYRVSSEYTPRLSRDRNER